ncbi:Carboxymethylenebutenolidase [BD1-7 clade bacterium]|uniref:Carboxymethylenebutenolidase n=1 Tax=BD1-7 clade bacterium TaxID=2029982 RepID=A0A5S9MZM7_9GAMM|nr:Carboxymethylenebutenolidase [BD1-7 clade bacterium]CAA0082745.1 Carboxymethylenebutenolidase [BD1-7 clade bacterium]
MKKRLTALALTLPLMAHAEIVTDTVEYTVDGKTFTGFLAYDNKAGKRPGILVVHEWWGHNDYARHRAKMLAEQGYTAFALDMYGKGKVADHPDNAKAFMTEVTANLSAAEKRFNTAYDLLNTHKHTQTDEIAAMGYCFGGGVVLHMARIGTPLKAAVSYHGSLASNLPEGQTPAVKGAIQVFTGAKDPMIPSELVTGFTTEMFNAGADFAVHVYPDAVHSFTNPGATTAGKKYNMPLAYDAFADKDSWQQTLDLFERVFPTPTAP